MSTQIDTPKTDDVTHIEPVAITSWLFERSAGTDPEKLEQLAEDMSEGQAEAITVREVGDGYQGVTGYRRAEAVDQFGDQYGIESVRAEVRDMSRFEAIQTRVHSNLDREEDTIYDQGSLCAMVAEELDEPTNADIGEIVGRSLTWVSQRLNALDHPPDVKEAVESGDLSKNAASALAQEPDADVRKKAIGRAQADESAEEAQKEALEEARLESGHAKDAAGELNRYADFRDRYEGGLEGLEEARGIETQIEDLEDERDSIWDKAPIQAQERYNEFKQAESRLSAVEDAQELVESESERLREEAESIRPSEEAETRLETWENKARGIEAQIGTPTVTATDKDNGDVSVQINVTFDPEIPPKLLGEFMELYHDYQELQGDIEDLADRMQRAERLKEQSLEVKANPGTVLETQPDASSISDDVRDVLQDHPEESLESVRENLAETVESADESELEDALSALEDKRVRVDEIDASITELESELPPQGEEGRVNGYQNNAREALEEAREHFNQLDDDVQAAKLEAWGDQYDDAALAYISGDGDMPDVLQPDPPEGPDIGVEQSGSWYTLSANGDELKVQGKDAMEEAREMWESDGFEAAEETHG